MSYRQLFKNNNCYMNNNPYIICELRQKEVCCDHRQQSSTYKKSNDPLE